jgi:signal transduction histidine kinase/ActR/RegA family two-component response regulator
VVVAEDRGRMIAAVSDAVLHNKPFEVEYQLQHKDGRILRLVERGRPGPAGDGPPTHIDGIIVDVTERNRATEALLQASRLEATATLAGGVAHDFNNLMVGVLGNAGLLRTDLADNPDALEMLNEISQAAQRAGDLAQHMLAYARGGRQQPGEVNLNDVIRDTLRLQERSISPGILVSRDLNPDLQPIGADATQLSQVVMNLCMNAAEAIKGPGTITVATRNVEVDEAFAREHPGLEPGPHVRLTVTDTGCGMSAKTLRHVFEPFFTTKFLGRGLGLAAVYGIVKNHHGYVGVESPAGRGSTFSVYLPVAAEKRKAPLGAASELPEGTETILVVDKEPLVVDVMQRVLRHLGYQILTTRDSGEALKIAKTFEGDIHLIVLDIDLLTSRGIEAYSRLVKLRPNVKVIISSVYDMNADVQAYLDQGASVFLSKPFRVEALAVEIRKALDAR